MGNIRNWIFAGKALDPVRTIQVPPEAAAASGITGWGRNKLGNAKVGVEGFLPFFFFKAFPQVLPEALI